MGSLPPEPDWVTNADLQKQIDELKNNCKVFRSNTAKLIMKDDERIDELKGQIGNIDAHINKTNKEVIDINTIVKKTLGSWLEENGERIIKEYVRKFDPSMYMELQFKDNKKQIDKLKKQFTLMKNDYTATYFTLSSKNREQINDLKSALKFTLEQLEYNLTNKLTTEQKIAQIKAAKGILDGDKLNTRLKGDTDKVHEPLSEVLDSKPSKPEWDGLIDPMLLKSSKPLRIGAFLLSEDQLIDLFNTIRSKGYTPIPNREFKGWISDLKKGILQEYHYGRKIIKDMEEYVK